MLEGGRLIRAPNFTCNSTTISPSRFDNETKEALVGLARDSKSVINSESDCVIKYNLPIISDRQISGRSIEHNFKE